MVHKGGGGARQERSDTIDAAGLGEHGESRAMPVQFPLYEQVLFLLVLVFLGLLLGGVEEHSRDAGSQSGDERQDESS